MARTRASRAADPATPLEELASLAHEHRELRPIIAANPSAYPDLLEWLATLGDPEVDAALAARVPVTVEVSTDTLRATDPATPQDELARLAYERPELRATVAANPNAYDDLRVWIANIDREPHAVERSTATVGRSAALLPFVGLLAPKLALIAGAVVLGLVVTGGTVAFSAVRASETITSIVAGEPLALGDGADGGSNVVGGTGGAGTGSTGVQPAAAPEPRYVPTVLILDASGSMVRDVSPGVTRMEAAKRAATTLVSGFGDDAQVGLTVFGTSTGNTDAERQAGCSDIRTLVPVGPIDKSALTDAISGIRQSGFTPIGPSLRDAVDQLAGADEGLIVVVSDGVDTCAPPSSCDVAAELRSAHRNITIHAVGFAVDADEQAQENLECVAQAGGGTYVDAGNADQLAARLRALTDPIATAGTVGVTGIDAVRLGMSLDQVEGVLGDLGETETILDIQYVDCDYGRLGFKDGRLWSIDPDESIATSEGIAVGEELTAATAIYGPGVPGEDGDGTYTTYQAAPGSESAYRFYYTGSADNATIVRIVICLCGTGGGGTSEVSNWLVSFSGVGPLTIDSTFDDADALLAGPMGRGPVGCTFTTLSRSGLGSQIQFTSYDSDYDHIALIDIGGSMAGAARLPRTDRGVGVGSTVAEWQQAYPDSTDVSDQALGRHLILTDAKGISLIAGDADIDGVIDYLQVGRPDRTFVAPCD